MTGGERGTTWYQVRVIQCVEYVWEFLVKKGEKLKIVYNGENKTVESVCQTKPEYNEEKKDMLIGIIDKSVSKADWDQNVNQITLRIFIKRNM